MTQPTSPPSNRRIINHHIRSVEGVRDVLSGLYQADAAIEGTIGRDFFVDTSVLLGRDVSLWGVGTSGGQVYDMRSSLDDIFIKMRIQGGYVIEGRHDTCALTHDTGAIFVPSEAIRYTTERSTTLSTLHIRRPAFDAALAGYCERPPSRWHGIQSFSLAGGFGQLVQALMSRYRENFSSRPDRVHSDTSLRLIQDAALIALADSIDIDRGDRFTASHRNIKQAVDMISGQTEPLTIHDIATALGISIRALQAGFRKHLSASPHNVLKTGRLEGARRDLLSGKASTVREAAAKWGFSNLARFANEYYALTGECPKETLRKGQGK